MPDVRDATLNFRARDITFSKTLRKMGRDMKTLGNTTVKALDRMSRRGSKFGTTMKGVFAGNLLGRGVMRAQQSLYELGETFVELDDSVTRAGSKFPEKIARGTKGFYELRDSAKQAGMATEFTMVEAAQSLDFLAMAGFNAKQSMAALPGLTDLATVANTDLANASNIASDSLTAFGLASRDPAQMAKNLTRVSDVLAKTTNTANTDIGLMFQTLQYAGPVVKASGQQIETFSAIAGKMANASIKGTKAGTAMKNMFLRLQAPAAKGRKAIKKLGIDIIDKSTGNIRDMVDILSDMEKAMAKMGGAKRMKMMDAIFGKRAIVGVSALFEQGIDGLRAYRKELKNAGGTSKEVAENIRGSLLNRLKQLKSALLGKGVSLIDAIMGDNQKEASKNLKSFIDKVKNFDIKPLAKDIRAAAEASAKLAKFIYRNKDAIITFGKAYIGLKLAMGAFNIGRATYQWGLLGTNIAMAASKAKGLGKVSAGLDAAMGGRAGAAGTSAQAGKFLKQPIGKMSIMGNIGAVAFAATAGAAIGTAIYEAFIGPSMDKFYEEEEKRKDKIFQSKMDIMHQTKPETTSIDQLKEQQRRVSGLLDQVSMTKIAEARTSLGYSEGGAGGVVNDLLGQAQDVLTVDFWQGIMSNETRVIGEANKSYEIMLQDRNKLLGQQAELDKRIMSVSERAAGRRAFGLSTETVQTGPKNMTVAPGFDNPMFRDFGMSDQKDPIENIVEREKLNREKMAKAVGDAVKQQPFQVQIFAENLPAETTLTATVVPAPPLSIAELGG